MVWAGTGETRLPGLRRAKTRRISRHVRLLGAPWWSYTVAFRDWLRSSPDARRAYEAIKERVAAEHAGDADYDDYTRGKTAFFREWQHAWAAPAGPGPSAGVPMGAQEPPACADWPGG
ncbi:MAG TPA: GrpB family protein, partial [Streptosporangiaceae bacterium]|nr:GrpB family protein [Streptosporangiaceae bacterium]